LTETELPKSELILYQTEDGRTRIQCRFEGDTVWVTQAQMAELFQVTPQNVTQHVQNIFASGELAEAATCKDYLQVRNEGNRSVNRSLRHYSLPVILAVGYRVQSPRGIQFRQWATARLGEYLVKGVAMDDERLKNPPGPGHTDYFDEILARVRDIRASERRFYQKVLDIYATSEDYEPSSEISERFFATVQNKMHWASHGHTAAEVIAERADGSKPMMGLQTTRTPGLVRKEDASVAKNYLTEAELQVLTRIVTLYLDYAELQALERKSMTMQAWLTKLDEFLAVAGRPLLANAGTVAAIAAKAKAELEYARFKQLEDAKPKDIDAAFEQAAKVLKSLPKPKVAKTRKGKP
jgi:hypothetical protein